MNHIIQKDRNMQNRLVLYGMIAAQLIMCLSAPAAMPDLSGMNILIICPEDWSAEAISVYGNKQVITPNLDRLAKTSTVFKRAYCQNPVCNGSRSSFNTGLRSESNNVYGNPYDFENVIPAWATTIGETLREHPIRTYMVGKLFHHNWDAVKQAGAYDGIFGDIPKGYQGKNIEYRMPAGTPKNPEKSWTYTPDPEWDTKMIEAMKVRKELWAEHPKGSPEWDEGRKVFQKLQAEVIGDSGEIEERSPDAIKARVVAELIRESAEKGEQFFITYGSSRPHTPLIAPKKYLDLYDPSTLELTKAPAERDRNIPDVAKRYGRNWDIFSIRDETPEQARAAIHAYYACVSYIDDQIGHMLDALEASGLADNTIVIFTSDHGFHLGEHGMWSKLSLFEQSTRVPFMVRIPGVTDGDVSHAIIELVDLYPTLCEILELPFPHDKLEGISFLPVIKDPDRDWKKAAFTVCMQGKYIGKSVRSESHRYTEWIVFEQKDSPDARAEFKELYDLTEDPYEQNNLADTKAHAAMQIQMAHLLNAGWKGALPENTVDSAEQ